MNCRRSVLGLACAAAALTACGGGSDPQAGRTPPPAAVTTPPAVSECPSPDHPRRTQWPAKVPADLPKPPNAHIDQSLTASDGVHIVKFTTPTSLRESVLFVVNRLPKAGYVLGRGDAEASEADAPFVHGDVRGLMRMIEVGACRTQWLLATVNVQAQGNSPLLPTHSPSASSSPLPFG